MQAKDLLIVSYTFPPASGIGGRRGSKFSKYLSARGHNIHVITAQNNDGSSEWSHDLHNSRISVHRVKTNYPAVLGSAPQGIVGKIRYRLWLLFFKFYSRGTLYDRSMLWKKNLIQKTEEVIRANQVKNIIVTIPPFRMAFYLLEIRRLFPGIRLIVDYRDPWTDNRSFHGFRNLPAARLSYEKKLEDAVLKEADVVITVSEDMTANLSRRAGQPASKFITISNGFDDAEIKNAVAKQNDATGKISFVYTGSLYDNLNYVTRPFLLYLHQLKGKDPAFYHRLSFDFYGSQDREFREAVSALDLEVVHLHGQVAMRQAHEKISAADFCLLFSAPDHAFSFNTKFFEYLGRRRPILLFSNPGATSDFISSNKLGAWIFPENMDAQLDRFFENVKKQDLDFNAGFDIDNFSVKKLSEKVEAILA